jgi:hypothetical protein
MSKTITARYVMTRYFMTDHTLNRVFKSLFLALGWQHFCLNYKIIHYYYRMKCTQHTLTISLSLSLSLSLSHVHVTSQPLETTPIIYTLFSQPRIIHLRRRWPARDVRKSPTFVPLDHKKI